MDDLKEILKIKLQQEIFNLYSIKTEVIFEVPANKSFGDLTTNIALKIAKEVGKAPQEIASELSKHFESISEIDKVEVVSPGFINFYLNAQSYFEVVEKILKENRSFGAQKVGEGREIMVEFGQPNTHKAFHVGHIKSAISGLSIVNLLENLGYKVIKANYFGDVGMHVAKTTWGFLKKGEPEGFELLDVHKKMKFIDECYVYASNLFKTDKTSEEEIRVINKEIYSGKETENVKTYKILREYSLLHQKEIWKLLGVDYDIEYPESTVFKDAIKIVNENKNKIFEQSEGAWVFKGEKYNLLTWVFETREGVPTYSAKDLALAQKKFTDYPNLLKSIVTTSVEQKEYFKAIIKVLELINPKLTGKYFHIPFGWMLRTDKKKFSSRMGDTVKGVDILDEVQSVTLAKISENKSYSEEEKKTIAHKVGIAGLKFLILSHEFYKDFSYDPDSFLSLEGFSGPYIMYSYARACSITSKETFSSTLPSVFAEEDEINLLKFLSQYEETVKIAGENLTPHTICNYVYNLSQLFNRFYTNCPVLTATDASIKNSRLKLTQASSIVIKNALKLLGIEAIDRM